MTRPTADGSGGAADPTSSGGDATEAADHPGDPARPLSGGFTRDRLTGMAYGGIAAYGFVLYLQGPLLPLLRADLHLSYAMMSAHSTVFAAGLLLANLLYERVRIRLGHRHLFWVAAASLVLGATLMAVIPHLVATLTAAALMGVGGAGLQTAALSVLSAHHGKHGERAVVEANASASATALAAPLVVGALRGAGADWHLSLLIPLAAAALSVPVLRREPFAPGRETQQQAITSDSGTITPEREASGRDSALGESEPRVTGEALDRRYGTSPVGAEEPTESAATRSGRPAPLGRLFWINSVLCGIAVALEFSLVLYGSPHLTNKVGLSAGAAGTAMSLFYAGELLGRLLGSRLTRQHGRTRQLIGGATALTTTAFLILWTAPSAVVALPALFVVGLGVANLFPLTLSLAIAAAPHSTDRATARVQLLIGAALMAAPMSLGTLSDQVGVERALTLEPVLAVALVVLLIAGRDRHSRTRSSAR